MKTYLNTVGHAYNYIQCLLKYVQANQYVFITYSKYMPFFLFIYSFNYTFKICVSSCKCTQEVWILYV